MEFSIKKFKQVRNDLKITQRMIADVLGCEPANISRIESGQNKLTLENLVKIVNGFKIDIYSFFELTDEEAKILSIGDNTSTDKDGDHIETLKKSVAGLERDKEDLRRDKEKLQSKVERLEEELDRLRYKLYDMTQDPEDLKKAI